MNKLNTCNITPLYFATGNAAKAVEIKEKFAQLNILVEIVPFEFQEPEVNDITIVSKSKVLEAYSAIGHPCFVIDSGFKINNYPGNPGYPGALVHRSGISDNIDNLLETLKETKDRSCAFEDCLTFYDGNEFYTFYGLDEGVISYEKKGEPSIVMRSNLWYVFIPNGFNITLAQMTSEQRSQRKDGHVSAKGLFASWYIDNYQKQIKLKREKKD